MRGPADVAVAVSMTSGLPTSFLGNDFTRHLVEAFDAVLAPVVATLDDLDAYYDARYAPEDFLRWVATWLGAPVDDRWPADRVRSHLPDLREAMVSRGTVAGLAAALRAVTGLEPEITDSGGVASSGRPLSPLPGSPRAYLRARVPIAVGDPDTMEEVVRRVVADMTPAHVPAEVVTERV